MSTRVWNGRDYKNLTVGRGPGYDYTNLQSALDAVEAKGDSDFQNVYCITIAPGFYESEIVHNVSHVVITAEVPLATVLTKSVVGSTPGTYSIGVDTTKLTENVVIEGLVISNQLEGSTGTGNPPEGALYISGENVWDTDLNWDRVYLLNNRIVGAHDALQIFGQSMTDPPGRLFMKSNYIQSLHDAVTLKGNARVMSNGNQVYVCNEGEIDLLPVSEPWKSTGFHFRNDSASPAANIHAFFESNGDSVWLDIRGEMGGPSQQDRASGILVYNPSNTVRQPAIRFVGTTIRVDYDYDYTPLEEVAAVSIDNASVGTAGDPSELRIHGMSARVHQKNAGASAPPTIYGVRSRTDGYLTVITDSVFDFRNAANSGAGVSVCLSGAAAGDLISYGNIHHNADTAKAGAGVIAIAAMT